MDDIRLKYINALRINNISNNTVKDTYTSLEILRTITDYKKGQTQQNVDISNIKDTLNQSNKQTLIDYILKINYSKKTKQELLHSMKTFIDNLYTNNSQMNGVLKDIFEETQSLIPLTNNINEIAKRFDEINTYMSNVKNTLDNAIHGHDKAKKQIERIIGQWINGKQDGYCFGFEGPPGIGKTSLAKKGLSACLKDDKGNSRPFAMIQMGGDSNGPSLHGHNYTYVGSTWGSIVQILIDKKCMNPIIFIDEIDKISKTEHGKEIIGILTHLLDPAQNDCFQDKYFSGIDLDLSKALFILSYNDADLIDKILLDRIHRVKFKSLSLEEKIVISNRHILPEVYDKMGLNKMIHFSNDVLKFIID